MKFLFLAIVFLLASCFETLDGSGYHSDIREVDGIFAEYVRNEFANPEHEHPNDVLTKAPKLSSGQSYSKADIAIKIIMDLADKPSLSYIHFSLIPSAQAGSPAHGIKYPVRVIRVLSNMDASEDYPKGSDMTALFNLTGHKSDLLPKKTIPLAELNGYFLGPIRPNGNEAVPIAIIAFTSESIINKGRYSFTVEVTLEGDRIYLFNLPEIQIN